MTFYIMKGFPQELIDELKQIWEENDWIKEVEAAKGKMWHHRLRFDHPVFKKFPSAIGSIEFYSNPPFSSCGPHLDRGRWSALNIPIIVDTEQSCFFTGKSHILSIYTNKGEHGYGHDVENEKGPHGFFIEEKEKFDYYNLEYPVLFSTKTPHGFQNRADTQRVLCSVTFPNHTIEQMVHMFPYEWFANPLED